MSETDEAIRRGWERVRRLDYLARLQVSLSEEIEALETQLGELRARLAGEERDVAKLRGIAGLFAAMSGDRDDRLTRERAEVEVARMRVRGHRARLEQSIARLSDVTAELDTLEDARQEYERALAAKCRNPEIAELGLRLASVEADWWEHEEARRATLAADQALRVVYNALATVSGVVRLDMSDRGFAALVANGAFGQADQAAWNAGQALAELGRQLDDIGVEARVELPEVDLRWFADMFLDDLVSDRIRYDRIRQTALHIQTLGRWVEGMVQHLTADCAQLASKCSLVRRDWDNLLT